MYAFKSLNSPNYPLKICYLPIRSLRDCLWDFPQSGQLSTVSNLKILISLKDKKNKNKKIKWLHKWKKSAIKDHVLPIYMKYPGRQSYTDRKSLDGCLGLRVKINKQIKGPSWGDRNVFNWIVAIDAQLTTKTFLNYTLKQGNLMVC